MGSKLATAFLAGTFFTFFLDFFFMLGIFLNYIQKQDIDVYYNILFADHQSIFLFFTGIVIFGYLFLFFPSTKIAAVIFALCFAVVNLTQIPSVGFYMGQIMFENENKIIQEGKHSYIGKVVYDGRNVIWFYDDELKKIIELKKFEDKENIDVK